MNDVTGLPAMLLLLLPVLVGVYWLKQSRDMVGLFVAGVCAFVFFSVATTGNAPAPNGDTTLALAVFGGFLLVYFIDTTKRLKAVSDAAKAAGAKTDQGMAGCMWLVMTSVILTVGAVIWFAVVELQP